jgi:hypothetical protein
MEKWSNGVGWERPDIVDTSKNLKPLKRNEAWR